MLLDLVNLDGNQKSDNILALINQTLLDFNLHNSNIFYVTDEGRNLTRSIEVLMKKPLNKCTSHVLHNLFFTDLKNISKDYCSILKKSHQIVSKLNTKQHLLVKALYSFLVSFV